MTLSELVRIEDLEARIRALELLFVEKKGVSEDERIGKHIADVLRRNPDAYRNKAPKTRPMHNPLESSSRNREPRSRSAGLSAGSTTRGRGKVRGKQNGMLPV